MYALRAFAVLPALAIGFDLSITAKPSLTPDVADVKIRLAPKAITLVTDMPKQFEEDDKEIYEQLACWCGTDHKEKTGSILIIPIHSLEDLTAKIEEYSASNADMNTDNQNLEKEVAENQEALDQDIAIREKELVEFNA